MKIRNGVFKLGLCILVCATIVILFAGDTEARQLALDRNLFRAVDESDALGVADALRSGGNPNARYRPHPDPSLVQTLLARMNRRAVYGCGTWRMIEKMREGETPLILACRNGNLTIARTLLANGANAHLASKSGTTPLIACASWGDVNVVRLLLNHNVNVNTRDGFGRTALIWAAESGRVEVLTVLLRAGADDRVRDIEGHSALLEAKDSGNAEAVTLLTRIGTRQ